MQTNCLNTRSLYILYRCRFAPLIGHCDTFQRFLSVYAYSLLNEKNMGKEHGCNFLYQFI